MGLFSFFSKLPAELRREVWKLAATAPRVIHLEVQHRFTALNGPHPLLRTCLESREVYKRQSHDKLVAENGEFLVDFTQDVFFFWSHPGYQPTNIARNITRKIEKTAFVPEAHCFIDCLIDHLPRVRQIDLVYCDEPYRYQPAPTSAFRQHSLLHPCRTRPGKYYSPLFGNPCPACVWLTDMYYDRVLFENVPRGFTLMLDCSLRKYPTKKEILDCEHPIIRFVKIRSHQDDEEGN